MTKMCILSITIHENTVGKAKIYSHMKFSWKCFTELLSENKTISRNFREKVLRVKFHEFHTVQKKLEPNKQLSAKNAVSEYPWNCKIARVKYLIKDLLLCFKRYGFLSLKISFFLDRKDNKCLWGQRNLIFISYDK